ncbi:hypothetical protein DCAR_0730061 [Daucus carota subsp. sativus]|uniref:Uncharacterized protein n=1 Tax=Daucus carota subsp. sativus TaxID=79200 RepID=A0AAF0XP03_DAUCS|nr:hypothetical protein DCAR_0730061 [Daucus carota subsp. sativus]
MQFCILIPIICDWLNQHLEGNLDELTRPKLPVIRLMSAYPKSEQSCAPSQSDRFSSQPKLKMMVLHHCQTSIPIPGPSSYHVANARQEDTPITELQTVPHIQGFPTPEIYGSPKLTPAPFRKNESALIQLLDINFLPRIIKPAVLLLHQPARNMHLKLDENMVKAIPLRHAVGEEHSTDRGLDTVADAEIASTGSVNVSGSEVESSSFLVEASDMPDQRRV